MEKELHVISGSRSWFASQIFNFGSIISVTFGAVVNGLKYLLTGTFFANQYITMAVVVIPFILWFAGSIFAYALVAHHPNERVGYYNRWAGYRFYAYTGFLPTALIFAGSIQEFFHVTPLVMWLWVGAIGIALIVPWGIYDIVKSRREEWAEVTVEVERHE
ncbi:MAG: hypothetical protein AB7U30_05015 [Sulfuricellaceae bacterium]|jgi:hypothetical protein